MGAGRGPVRLVIMPTHHAARPIDPEGWPDRHRALEILRGTDRGRVAVSRQALPLLAPARHVVVGAGGTSGADESGAVLLQLHRGHGYHSACDGNVIAYGADAEGGAAGAGPAGVWSVQFVGTAWLVTPAPAELSLFGPAPRLADGAPYDPVYLRVVPRFVTVHHLESAPMTVCQTVPYGDPQ